MILVLGGTSESRDITVLLVVNGYRVIYSSTTGIIDDLPSTIGRFTGMLDEQSLNQLLCRYKVRCVIDATHPFAVKISALAIGVTRNLSIPYIRLERHAQDYTADSGIVKHADTLEAAVQLVRNIPGRILSTLGTRMLPHLCAELGDRAADLVARVLPTSDSIMQCEKLGIHPSRICAMQGPFSREFNRLCIEHFKATTMLSKESGDQGGVQEKKDACIDTGCTLVIIKRPRLEYPRVCTSTTECLDMLRTILHEPLI